MKEKSVEKAVKKIESESTFKIEMNENEKKNRDLFS